MLSSCIDGLSLLHWMNDALMAVFFLLVGLEIKRGVLQGGFPPMPNEFFRALRRQAE